MATLGNRDQQSQSHINRLTVRYVRDIPSTAFQKLCRMLDVLDLNDMNWKRLAGILGFHNDEINAFGRDIYRASGSPTDVMLRTWDYMNHSVQELYDALFQMRCGRAMGLLKDYVDKSEHYKIDKCRGIVPPAGPIATVQEMQFRPGLDPSQLPSPPLPNRHSTNMQVADQLYYHNPHGAKEDVWHGDTHHSVLYMKPADAYPMYPNMDSSYDKKLMSPQFDPQFVRHVSTSDNVQNELGNKSTKQSIALNAMKYINSFPNASIVNATNNFSDDYKRGEGAFGTVYVAQIDYTMYAVKRLKQKPEMGYDADKFAHSDQLKEITALVRYRHTNIVPLLGYSCDGPLPCLIYEYCENGSLEDNLLCRDGRKPLDWMTRHDIVVGAAIGLNFLHCAQENKPLIHGDIKSANILLGKDFVPKIGDFGLARDGPSGGKAYTMLNTKEAHGTLPYLPNEYKRNYKLSTKVDVFSFGVVLLEVLTGQRAYDERREPQRVRHVNILVSEILDQYPGSGSSAIDQLRDRKCPHWPWDLAMELLDIACKCINEKFMQRPDMKKVVEDLHELNNKCKTRNSMHPKEGQTAMEVDSSFPSPMNSVRTIKAMATEKTSHGSICGLMQQKEMHSQHHTKPSLSNVMQQKMAELRIGMNPSLCDRQVDYNRVDTQNINTWHKEGPCESSDGSVNTSKLYTCGYSTQTTPDSSVRTPSSVPTSHSYDSSMPITDSSCEHNSSMEKYTFQTQKRPGQMPGFDSPVGMLQSGEYTHYGHPRFPDCYYRNKPDHYAHPQHLQQSLSTDEVNGNLSYQQNGILKTHESYHYVIPQQGDGDFIPDPSLVPSPQFSVHQLASPPVHQDQPFHQLNSRSSPAEKCISSRATLSSESTEPTCVPSISQHVVETNNDQPQP